MKKILLLTVALLLLMAVGVSSALAGDGDPVPGVTTIPGVKCGVPAGDYGWFLTGSWWYATYSNGVGVLKCTTHLNKGQVPPAELLIIPAGTCGTPGGVTDDAFTKIFPDGRVTLICRVH